jgi:hypothetical protein
MGCVEQFQFCVPQMQFPSFCSKWGAREQNFWETLQYLGQNYLNQDLVPTLETWDDQSGTTASEMLAFFLYLPRSLAVFDYVGTRIQLYDKVPLIEKTAFNPIQRLVDNKEQWVLEAETWFIKAFLGGIFLVQDAIFWNFKDFEPGFSEKYIREWSLCGRVLLRDGNYTNVNWIGFWATTATLTLISLLGNRIEQIYKIGKNGFPTQDWLAQLKESLTQMKRSFTTFLMTLRNLPRLWKSPLFMEVVRMRRPWYGSRNPNTGCKSYGVE